MKVNGKNYRTIWPGPRNSETVFAIDQNKLPFSFEILMLNSSSDVINAIKDMAVRGAPLIGAAGAFGVYLSALEAKRKYSEKEDLDKYITERCALIQEARPTAVNLNWAVRKSLLNVLKEKSAACKIVSAFKTANGICEDDVRTCRNIGMNGVEIIKRISSRKKNGVVNILTHCNAGWLAVID
ncbi:MAG: S-methyl-5-thioribose-1-phosphate isomerase, partial [Ignavibacteria bacterium]|nr:S-methyl-5-thioribose-1-phosphate isomerase [Ignavibacteria bacterium]